MKRKLVYICLISILVLAMVLPLSADQKKRKGKVQFFAPGSVYLYTGVALNSINPDHILTGTKETAVGPLFGVGCRVIDFGNNFSLNLEFDYTMSKFGTYYFSTDGKVRFLNFKLGGEFWFAPKDRFALLVNIGVTSIDYSGMDGYYYDDNELALSLEIGAKIKFSKHLSLRADLRFFLEPDDGEYDYYDYYDEYNYDGYTYYNEPYWDDSSSRLIAWALSVGLQFNF